ncbi:MAG TPA: hypothetical protein VGN20_14845 [Mucilaginibacter sp.]|jgi:chromosome condensin MukBEF ATPase and DNA-binding subunit MukB
MDLVENPFEPKLIYIVERQNHLRIMADINKFIRSKDRLEEIHNFLTNKRTKDEETESIIINVEESIKVIDHKMEEFKRKGLIGD